MKTKNNLVARINVDGFTIPLMCCRNPRGFKWYGVDNKRVVGMGIPASPNLKDAKASLLATYPPRRYNMVASWL